ncbi:WIAG-tail domain [Paenibacillus sp. DYY-L-2]|uniref:WIAG-tail domain n=1 Tax=Paenibacillus sp. DYY-L-2 TaxID=3447013 RepID=UPI003F503F45
MRIHENRFHYRASIHFLRSSPLARTRIPQFNPSSYVIVTFEEPFANSQYVLVATPNQPAYYATLKEQTPEMAVLEVTRIKESQVNFGFISWIAIGNMN